MLLWIKSVEFGQQLVQGLFFFVVPAPAIQSAAARAAKGVHLVDKNYARRGFASLSKEIAYTSGTHADKHFDELGATDGEEWHSSFTSDGSGE